ncbi:hypothetical protein PR048_022866 [Dryococelus australis]|uniref:Uncharacterized protein n=1 Tax=Dryococelus australis TaxID=614101 RepID=A0ABQ9GSF4_9NEOP|nr:hypothetical protein PR048_022866 [Dryococelus australis]
MALNIEVLGADEGDEVSMEQRRNEKGEGNVRSPRKPANQRHQIVPDDATGPRVFSGISRFPRPYIPLPHDLIGSEDLNVNSQPNFFTSLKLTQSENVVYYRVEDFKRAFQINRLASQKSGISANLSLSAISFRSNDCGECMPCCVDSNRSHFASTCQWTSYTWSLLVNLGRARESERSREEQSDRKEVRMSTCITRSLAVITATCNSHVGAYGTTHATRLPAAVPRSPIILIKINVSDKSTLGYKENGYNSRLGRTRIFARRWIWSAGFLGGLPFPPTIVFRHCSILTSLQPHVGSQDLDVTSPCVEFRGCCTDAVLRWTAQRAPGVLHSGRRHGACHSVTPNIRVACCNPPASWLVVRILAYQRLARHAPFAATSFLVPAARRGEGTPGEHVSVVLIAPALTYRKHANHLQSNSRACQPRTSLLDAVVDFPSPLLSLGIQPLTHSSTAAPFQHLAARRPAAIFIGLRRPSGRFSAPRDALGERCH